MIQADDAYPTPRILEDGLVKAYVQELPCCLVRLNRGRWLPAILR